MRFTVLVVQVAQGKSVLFYQNFVRRSTLEVDFFFLLLNGYAIAILSLQITDK